jgi:paraquat-inducible protein A
MRSQQFEEIVSLTELQATPTSTMAGTEPQARRHLRACPICGQFQIMPALSRRQSACCVRCGSVLRRDRTDPAGRALALATTAMLMFWLAASLPFMSIDLAGGQQIHVITGPEALDNTGMWALALVVLITTMAAPLAKLVAVAWVMIGLRLRHPPRYLATVFRWVEYLTPWSMIEVFMLAVFVAYAKLGAIAPVHIGGAAYALGVLMLAMAATDSAIDHEAIWQRLAPEPAPPRIRTAGMMACDACGEVSDHHGHCPRCGAALHRRKPHSLARAWALLIASAILYIPANTLPILTVIQFGQGAPSTIIGGVLELAEAGQWPLAVLVFVASITVPVLKVVGLALLLITTQRGMRGHLAERTLLYKIVEAVGRWSMLDVFMISIITALVQAGEIATITPGPGAVCFCAVVILTMLAAISFDPRLMWDAARPNEATLPP